MEGLRDIESTEVLKMELNFQNFVTGGLRPPSRKRQACGPAPFDLDEETSYEQPCTTMSSSVRSAGHVTIGSLMEKNKEVRKKEAALAQAKATIAELENRIINTETSRKRQMIEHEQEMNTAKQEAIITKDKLEELRSQVRILAKREEDARRDQKDCRHELATSKTELGAQVSELRKEKIELEAKVDEMDCLSRSQIMALKNEQMRQNVEMDICRSERAEAQDLLTSSQKRCNEFKKHIQELEEYRSKALEAELKVKELQTKLNQIEDDALITKTMKSQLSHLSDMERENRKLKEENTYLHNTRENIHLLREELESTKQKLLRSEARAIEGEKLKATCEDLQERLYKWESCHVPGSNRPRSPTEMSRQIADLQQTSLLSLEKQGELQTNERLMAQKLEAANEQLKTVREKLVLEQRKCAEHTDFTKRIQRKLLLLKKERDGYKQVLDSYERESPVSPAVAGGGGSTRPNTTQLRVRQLEDSIQVYRNHMALIEKQRDEAINAQKAAENKAAELQFELQNSQHFHPAPSTSEVDQKIISSLREQVAEVERELQKVTEERDILAARIEQRHLQGDFDPTTTKVIHMHCNPTSLAQEERAREMGRLRSENKNLEERIKLLEEGGGQVDDLTVKVQEKLAQPSTSAELEALQAALTSAELKNKRLMEAFRKKSLEFREACFQLLGYRIDIPTDKQYRLMNIYAEGPDDYLLFQQDDRGMIQLLSNEYSSTLTDKVDTYLSGANSIPGFLSSVTLMLFNRQTMFQQSMVTS